MSAPRIAIIGAGPGGLTLARILQHGGMACTLFEIDENKFSRDQGGIVDLQAESGQLALREAGLFEVFQKHSLPAAEAMKLMKSDGRICWDENDSNNLESQQQSRDRPEIDRRALRDILLDSVDPASIQWGRKLLRVEATKGAEKKYDLHFASGVEEEFDLVVGADGAWSRVRPLLTDQVPFYSGVTGVELRAAEVSTKNQWLANFNGTGSLFMFDEGRAIICQRQGNDSIRVYACVRQPETWIKECGIDWKQQDLARETIRERYFGDCHDDLKRAITIASDGLIARPLYMLPVGIKWDPRPGLTLLGDAAHLMTPFAGVGVNVALTDALDLARALLKRKAKFEADLSGNLVDALREYEEPMFERAKKNMQKTMMGLQGHFSADGIELRIKWLLAREKQIPQAKTSEEAKQRGGGAHTTVSV